MALMQIMPALGPTHSGAIIIATLLLLGHTCSLRFTTACR